MRVTKEMQSFKHKNRARILMILFIISLLPIIYCSFFNYATGDDLWEGAVAYRILQSGGSLKELFNSVFEWMKVDYFGWQGNWSSTFLWCFSPNVFGEKVYIVTAWIGLASIVGGNWYFMKYFNKKYLKFEHDILVLVYILVCFFSIQYMPYIRGGIFWYSAMINYTFPYGVTLAAFVWIDKWMEDGKWKYLLYLCLFYTFLGGSGYLCIVLNFEIIVLIVIKSMINKDKNRKKRSLFMLLPLILLMVGFIISLLSPGNAVRGGDSYEFGIVKVLNTLCQCIIEGASAIPRNFWEIKLFVVILPFLTVLLWNTLNTKLCTFKFKNPVMATILIYLIYCSVYAPGIYSESDLSGGVYDTIYFVFVLSYFMIVLYWIGYIKNKVNEEKDSMLSWIKKIDVIQLEKVVAILTIVICVLGANFLFSSTACKLSYDFIVTGQLADFEEQMQERLAILNDPEIQYVVLPEMNDQQGPLMHMPLMADPNAYTNHATARFYGKESVVAIPRDEYNRLYSK